MPNNDIKYDIAKKRAVEIARQTKKAIYWCPAKDYVSTEALLDEPTLPEKKLDWLQRHDQESGKLYGMLPLFEGLLVCRTDHIDRNPDKNLLRGRKGRVVGWELDEREPVQEATGDVILHYLPKVVYVEFMNPNDSKPKWKLPGCTRRGVYPVAHTNGTWFLDRRLLQPKLKIKRQQMPLAPAFAMTANASQGQTLSE